MGIIDEIVEEAQRQRLAHPHDIYSDGHGLQSRYKWIVHMLDRLSRSDDAGPPVFRAGMIGLAAMCCRAVEAFDRGATRRAEDSAIDCQGEDEESDASKPEREPEEGPPSSRR